MPQRIRDVFAWVRKFMDANGPPATTRLVLFAHSLFMVRDGSRCTVGVRRLARVTGLDKTTVGQHRAAAMKLGWLIGTKRPRGQGSGELFAAIPDAVHSAEADADADAASSDTGQAPSAQGQLSGLTRETVRNQPANRPAKPDVPSSPLKPLRARLETTRNGGYTQTRNPVVSEQDLKEQLRNWMSRDPTVAEYLSIRDIAAIAKLTPERLRVRRYEEIIEILVAELAPSTQ